MTVAVYTYTRNCVKIDYPFLESVQSSLLIADRVFVCDCESTDGTWEVLQAAARADNRIEVMRHPWGDHYRVQGQVCNGMLERIEAEGYTWALQVQADEVVCEWTAPAFREDLRQMAHGRLTLGRPLYRHFCPDYRTTWPFIYDRKSVLSSCKKGHRYDANSDACSLPPSEWSYKLGLEIHHVGKVSVGREEKALAKELEFQEMYRDLGFPDPKFLAQRDLGRVDYVAAFGPEKFTPYHGPHPSVLLPRIMRTEGHV